MSLARPLSIALSMSVLVFAIGFLQPTGLFAPLDGGAMHLVGVLRRLPGAGLVTSVAIWLDVLGTAGGRAMIAISIGMFLARAGRPDLVIRLVIAAMGTSLVNSLIKLSFDEPRPDLLEHLVATTGTSFPSGHAAGAMALYGALALMTKSRLLALACVGMALATGLSRVWLGVHWPSDVCGGFAVGLAWLAIVWMVLPGRGPFPSVGAWR